MKYGLDGDMNGKIEIVMRKSGESGEVTETVLASFSWENTEKSTKVLIFPELEIYLQEQAVYHNNTLIPMSHHEFFTLLYLAQHPNWVFSKEQIYEAVWKENPEHCGTAVTNVISQIRRKIGNKYIKTVVGSGYKFEK